MQTRPTVLGRELDGQFRTASEFVSNRKDDGCIRIANVPFGALCRIGVRCFGQVIFGWDYSIFGPACARAPATVLQSALAGKV